EDDEGKVEAAKEDQVDRKGETAKEEEPPASQNDVNVCKTVEEALKGKLDDACTLKYSGNNSRLGWKCIPSGKPGDTGSSGAICVPPRRRRLYVTPLTKWAETVAQPQESGEKEREEKEKKEANGELPGFSSSVDGGEQNPQTLLQNGTIPPDFLRLMFYTLGDYRDICVGKTPDGIDTVSGKDTMENIKKAIESVFKPSSGTPSLSVEKTTRESWWEKNGEHIWKGMICALTYKENGADGTNKIEKDSDVYKKIFGENNTDPDKKLTVTTVDNKGTFESKYKYDEVELKEDNENGAKSAGSSLSGDTPTLNNPKLKDFVKLPPFFRWLHEWGSDFCVKRAQMLKEVRDNCLKRDGRTKKCSGYGENCDDILSQKYNIFKDFDCPSCSKPCGLYKRWISRKKAEFDKQSNAYGDQKTKCVNGNNNHDKEFCRTLKDDAAQFLENLGSCKNDNTEEGKKRGDILDFTKPEQTFQHTDYCDPCSQFKINCRNGNCKSDDTNSNCKDKDKKDITAKDIQNKTDPNGNIEMLVSDDSTNGVEGDLNDCIKAGIFKGIRKDAWKCDNVCGYVVCKPEKGNGKENQNKIITIRALLHRWLEYFLEDYNKIKHKISHCTKNGEGSKCENKCEEKCKKCIDEWIKLKQKEWKEIKNRLVEQYKNDTDSPINFNVKSSLEKFEHRPEFKKAIKPCGGLTAFEESCGLNGADRSKKSKKGTQQENDLVLCMIKKLGEKAKNCPGKTSDSPEEKCGEDPTPLENDEETMEEENPENMRPNICPPPEKEKVKDKDGCKPASPDEEKKDVKKEESAAIDPVEAEEKEETVPQEPEPPAAPPTKPSQPPSQKPRPALDDPAVIPSLVTSTLAWSVGIGFAAFTYFFLK
ncbi:hypothetical protein PFFVO_06005, partial [Plasmodium falciparum Vietnam Oak-Knoll (FVO)]